MPKQPLDIFRVRLKKDIVIPAGTELTGRQSSWLCPGHVEWLLSLTPNSVGRFLYLIDLRYDPALGEWFEVLECPEPLREFVLPDPEGGA